jgi:hypothetical protein
MPRGPSSITAADGVTRVPTGEASRDAVVDDAANLTNSVQDGIGNDRSHDLPDAQDTVVEKPREAPSTNSAAAQNAASDTVVDAPADVAAGQASSAASTSAAASGTAAGTLGTSAAVAAVPVLNVLAALVPR